jgi:hypothetical protein
MVEVTASPFRKRGYARRTLKPDAGFACDMPAWARDLPVLPQAEAAQTRLLF